MRYLTVVALLVLAACTEEEEGFVCTDRDTSSRLRDYAPEGASDCVTDVMLVGALFEECTAGYTRPTLAEAEADCEGDHGLIVEPWCWDIFLASTCHEMAQPQESAIIGATCELFQPSKVIPSCAAAE